MQHLGPIVCTQSWRFGRQFRKKKILILRENVYLNTKWNNLYSNKRRYCVTFNVGHFWPPNFGPISIQYQFFTPIYVIFTPNFSPLCHSRLSLFLTMGSVCGALLWGLRWGSHGWQRIFCGCARKIILARNLLCQPESQCWVPVRFWVLQRTGSSSSEDHL